MFVATQSWSLDPGISPTLSSTITYLLILPIHYSYTVARQLFKVSVQNSVAGTDEYDVEPRQLKLVKIVVHILFDNTFFVVAAKKAHRPFIIGLPPLHVLFDCRFFAYSLPCKQIKGQLAKIFQLLDNRPNGSDLPQVPFYKIFQEIISSGLYLPMPDSDHL